MHITTRSSSPIQSWLQCSLKYIIESVGFWLWPHPLLLCPLSLTSSLPPLYPSLSASHRLSLSKIMNFGRCTRITFLDTDVRHLILCKLALIIANGVSSANHTHWTKIGGRSPLLSLPLRTLISPITSCPRCPNRPVSAGISRCNFSPVVIECARVITS